MYKVFINDRPLYLTERGGETPIGCDRVHHFDSVSGLKAFVGAFRSEPDIPAAVVIGSDRERLFEHFKSLFTGIEAAGGVVQNGRGEVLVIRRSGKWDLPKGKLEKGEDPARCAVREIEEECGISGPEIAGKLADTYHTYPYGDGYVLKKTHWYRMTYAGDEELSPQTEEDITEVRWFKPDELPMVRADTYGSIRDVLAEAGLG